MKKTTLKWLFFFLCLVIFLTLRFHSLFKPDFSTQLIKEKSSLLQATVVTQANPWLSRQPNVKGAAMEMMRDLEKIRFTSSQIPQMSEKELTLHLMQKLLILQEKIPFHFPDVLYNVLCITETDAITLAPFHTYKRLYLSETELGLPFYLDVRVYVYDLDTFTAQEIIGWYVNILNGPCEILHCSEDRQSFLCKGMKSKNLRDTTYGFTAFQGERGLFVDFYEKEHQLYVCYAEAPLSTFIQQESLLRTLCQK